MQMQMDVGGIAKQVGKEDFVPPAFPAPLRQLPQLLHVMRVLPRTSLVLISCSNTYDGIVSGVRCVR